MRSPPTSPRKGLGEKQHDVAPARLGHLAPALLGHADPDHPLRRTAATCRCPRRTCRSCCPRTACPTAAATRSNQREDFLRRRLPALRRAGARARPTRWTRSSIRRGTSCATRRPSAASDGRRARRLLDADGPVHRRHRARDPAPALRALLDQGDARLRPGAASTSRSRACSRRAWCSNAAFFRRNADGRHRLRSARPRSTSTRDAQGAIIGGDAQGRRAAGRVRRHRHDVEVEEQRRRPAGADRPLRRRHRAPLRDVRSAARAHARMVRHRRRRRAPLPEAAVGLRAVAARRACRRAAASTGATRPMRSGARGARSTRRCKQADYDYERIQYNTVVSAGMKMLNTLEDVPCGRRRRGRARARRPVDPAARALSGRAAHRPGCCGASSASPTRTATCSTRRGPRSTRRRSRRTRSSSCCRSTASCAASSSWPPTADRAAIEAAARVAPEVARHGSGGDGRKVIVVPGRLVNVVV